MPALLQNRRLVAAIVIVLVLLATFAWWSGQERGASPYLVVLGIAQDGGLPHVACQKERCTEAARAGRHEPVSCLALVDPRDGRRWIFDATPDLPDQLRRLDAVTGRIPDPEARDLALDGIFLTHAHIGHYTGLMYLGREAMGAEGVPVHALPRMRDFLLGNGPWGQLVELGNIELRSLEAGRAMPLGEGIRVTPWLVPHRDEYSETAGFLIETPGGSALYLPDIDKWGRWSRDLADVLEEVDHAFVDATFFSADELPGRSLEEIPHPTIEETIELLSSLPERHRRKVHFLHLNHSNPAWDDGSDAYRSIRAAAMDIATVGEVYRFD